MERYEISNFAGGLQTKTSFLFAKPNELSKLINSRVDLVLGALTNIPGYSQLGNTIAAQVVVGLYEYSKANGTRQQIAACNGDLWSLSGSTWNAQVQTISTGVKSDFTVFLDKLFWINGVNAPRSYNGTAWLTTTSQNSDLYQAPQGHLAEVYKGKVYIANKTTSKVYLSSTPREILGVVQGDHNNVTTITLEDSRYCYPTMVVDVYKPGENVTQGDSKTISAVNYSKNQIVMAAAQTFSDGAELKLEDQTGSLHIFWGAKQDDYLEIDPSDGTNISAMITGKDFLHIWKDRSYHTWDNYTRKRRAEQGASNQEAVQVYNDLVFHFNQEGLWAWSGERSQIISRAIDPEIGQIVGTWLPNVSSGIEEEHLLIYIDDLTNIGNAMIDYDISSNIYQIWELPHIFRVFSPYTTGGKAKVMAGTSDGKIMELNSGSTFAGNVIYCKAETNPHFITLPEEKKIVYQIFVFAKEWTGVSVYLRVDNGDVIPLGELKGIVTEFNITKEGYYFQIGFLSQGKSIEIDSAIIYYDRLKAVR